MAKKELDRFDTNARHNIKISTKLRLLMVAGVIISSVGVCLLSLGIFNSKTIDNTIEDLSHTASGVEFYISAKAGDLSHYSKIFSKNTELQRSVEYNSSYSLQKILTGFTEDSTIDFLFVTDASGRVMNGGGINITEGVDVSYIGTVSSALAGEGTVGIEGVADFEYAIIASEPIYINGSLKGTVVTGYNLSGTNFIDYIASSYNVECTILKNDTRVASTLLDTEGNSVVGTKLNDSFIEESVFFDGNSYICPV